MNRSDVPEYVMNTLCRICAEKSSKLTPIFENEALTSKIFKCLSIEVTESDHLPLNVCELCFFKIDESFSLYETAQRSDEKLKKLWRILIKETMTCYPETTQEKSEVLLVNETPALNESEMSPNLIINIPDDVLVDGQQVVSNEVMVVGRAITFEIITQGSHEVLEQGSTVEQYTQLQVEEVQQEEQHKPEGENTEKSTSSTKVYQNESSGPGILSVQESVPSEEKPFLCDTCGKSFKHANNLRCHSRVHLSVRKKYVCKICNKGFLTNFFLQQHMYSHTGETPYKCQVCGKEFREKVHLRQHRWTHSSEKFTCPVCGNKFNRKGNMNEHIKKYHKNNSMGKSSVRKKPEGKPKESTNLKCSLCSCVFSNPVLLKTHLKSHPEQKRFFCSICGKKFRHSGSLTYHRRTAHTGERPFQCSYCDEKFSLRSVQRIHERKKHTFEQPYKCTFCSRLFTNSSSLRNHLFVHSKDKMFECDECGKKFSRSSNLFVHKKLHSGDRQFTCDQCGKTYIQKHDMLKHKKVHDPKSKPFFCKYCGNSFSRKKDSSKHAMCQFDFLRKNNTDFYSAEKILDSVTNSLEKSAREFFIEEELILESVEEFSGEKISKSEGVYGEAENLNSGV